MRSILIVVFAVIAAFSSVEVSEAQSPCALDPQSATNCQDLGSAASFDTYRVTANAGGTEKWFDGVSVVHWPTWLLDRPVSPTGLVGVTAGQLGIDKNWSGINFSTDHNNEILQGSASGGVGTPGNTFCYGHWPVGGGEIVFPVQCNSMIHMYLYTNPASGFREFGTG